MKDSDGKLIVDLPEKVVSLPFFFKILCSRTGRLTGLSLLCVFQITLENLEFSTFERKFYDSLYSLAKRQFNAYQQAGTTGSFLLISPSSLALADTLLALELSGKNYGRILFVLLSFTSETSAPLRG